MMRETVAALMAAMLALPSAAQDVDAALDRWLGGEDLPALAEIAEAARAGDADARLFLGTVEHMGELHGADVAALDRAGRIALFRDEGGLSGRSWIAEEAGELPALIRDIEDARTAPETVAALHALGEARLAREALRAQAKREHFALVARSLDAVPDLAPVVAGLVPGAAAKPAVVDLDLGSADAAPLRAVCGASCLPECLMEIADAIGGHDGLMQMGSPVVALIPEETWRDSARARMAVAGLARMRDRTLPDCAQAAE